MERRLEGATQKHFESLCNRIKAIDALLSSAISDSAAYTSLAKERSKISPAVETYNRFISICKQQEDVKQMALSSDDKQIAELAEEELETLEKQKELLLEKLEDIISGEQNTGSQDIILEIRAGTGGQEAALFVADLYRMYNKYAQSRGWSWESIDTHPSQIGGLKEVVIGIKGESVYNRMKYESGVHRVQRVPATESMGRVHTSTVSVAVLQQVEDIDVKIEPKDIRIDVYRSSGKGGQGVNTTDSAVRITHIPTGIIVTCQDERSQLKNKAKAMKVLKARLYDLQKTQTTEQIAHLRKTQIGSAERSEKIRTYNFPEHRITDHRAGLTVYRLQDVIDGDLDIILEPLLALAKQQRLQQIVV
jgi:peptide chain release factor 1